MIDSFEIITSRKNFHSGDFNENYIFDKILGKRLEKIYFVA